MIVHLFMAVATNLLPYYSCTRSPPILCLVWTVSSNRAQSVHRSADLYDKLSKKTRRVHTIARTIYKSTSWLGNDLLNYEASL